VQLYKGGGGEKQKRWDAAKKARPRRRQYKVQSSKQNRDQYICEYTVPQKNCVTFDMRVHSYIKTMYSHVKSDTIFLRVHSFCEYIVASTYASTYSFYVVLTRYVIVTSQNTHKHKVMYLRL